MMRITLTWKKQQDLYEYKVSSSPAFLYGGSAAQWLGRLPWDREIPGWTPVLIRDFLSPWFNSRLRLQIANWFVSGQLKCSK